MENLRDFAGRLDADADRLTAVAGILAASGSSVDGFGADAPGRLGELGHTFSARWMAAAEARAREAAAVAVHLRDAAAALRVATTAYADTDDAARRRQAEEA